MEQDFSIACKLFDAVPLYIILFDCNGNIKMANKLFLDAVDISKNEISGMTLEDLNPHYDLPGWEEQLARFKHQNSWTSRTLLVDKTGYAVPIEQTLVHIEDECLDCILCIGHDISESIKEKQKQVTKLRQAERAVKEANRLKSEFIAKINHEIRTPMNAIIGYSEMLSASDLDDREQRFVKTICKNGATLISILNSVVELSKKPGFESEFGQGNSFTSYSYLPSDLDGDVERRKKNTEYNLYKEDNKRDLPLLLVVDDMPMISEVICDYFSQGPLEVLVAENSKDGLELARSHQPDLILMDLSLPDMDGREVTRLLREDSGTGKIPVVVMTGRMLKEQDYKPLFDDFLAKPFHLNELQRIVDTYTRVKDSKAVSASPVRNKNVPEQVAGQIRVVWDDDLAVLLDQALVSGSLDSANTLGLQMFERGEQLGLEHLMDMGNLLRDYAVEPDIIGVEQLLALLQKYTGES